MAPFEERYGSKSERRARPCVSFVVSVAVVSNSKPSAGGSSFFFPPQPASASPAESEATAANEKARGAKEPRTRERTRAARTGARPMMRQTNGRSERREEARLRGEARSRLLFADRPVC